MICWCRAAAPRGSAGGRRSLGPRACRRAPGPRAPAPGRTPAGSSRRGPSDPSSSPPDTTPPPPPPPPPPTSHAAAAARRRGAGRRGGCRGARLGGRGPGGRGGRRAWRRSGWRRGSGCASASTPGQCVRACVRGGACCAPACMGGCGCARPPAYVPARICAYMLARECASCGCKRCGRGMISEPRGAGRGIVLGCGVGGVGRVGWACRMKEILKVSQVRPHSGALTSLRQHSPKP